MTSKSFLPILPIVLGLAIAGLGVGGIVWIVASHLLGHGVPVVLIGMVFFGLGAICILEGVRQLRTAPSSRP